MWMPRGRLCKAVRHVAANYRDFFKWSRSPKDSDGVWDEPRCWQWRHLFNPTAKASQRDWLCLFLCRPSFTCQWSQRTRWRSTSAVIGSQVWGCMLSCSRGLCFSTWHQSKNLLRDVPFCCFAGIFPWRLGACNYNLLRGIFLLSFFRFSVSVFACKGTAMWFCEKIMAACSLEGTFLWLILGHNYSYW